MILKLYLELNNHLKCLKVLMVIETVSTSLADITLGKTLFHYTRVRFSVFSSDFFLTPGQSKCPKQMM